ncbi:hypothetical protein M9H77_31546 [Catharanthus roseus]|uniref:Uncharacterized protein n=1 Tax=Catharanthus roseus TaxID=4058 RepID=A0ACC0A2G5_CATRO|nr:hypothetical protein M9H77_31546 [Catharanthus roseus]
MIVFVERYIIHCFIYFCLTGKKIEKCHTGTSIPRCYPGPWRVGLGPEFYTLDGMGSGLGPSFTIRVRVSVWGYPEGLDPFTALHVGRDHTLRVGGVKVDVQIHMPHMVQECETSVMEWEVEI